MRKSTITITFFLFLISVTFFTSCEKRGEEIEFPAFSELTIDASMSANTTLLIKVDDEVSDTLRSSTSLKIKLKAGERKISILDSENKSLVDTTLFFEKYESKALSRFLYTGSALLFSDPDVTRKPATAGNVLIRFVTTASSLPDRTNIEIVLFYTQSGTRVIVPMNITVNNVGKNTFSDYIELPNPASLLPAGVASGSYAVIGTDADTGELVMGIDVVASSPVNSYAIVRFMDCICSTYVPNNVISLGIDEPQSTATRIRQTKAIFERVAE